MAKWQERAELLFKSEGLKNLKNSNVLVVGLGGVGSFAAEFLVRAGVGTMTIIDGDTVVVNSPAVAAPVAVRYAFGSNPEGANLYNRAGLPASPFSTE